MLCEKCGTKTATTHIRTVINGQVHEKHLCASCAAIDGYNTMKGNNITQILSSIFDDTFTGEKGDATRCACCGSTINDITNSGKCGCAQCYSTFYEQLLPYFKRSQYGGTTHKGKMLDKAIDSGNIGKIAELKSLLNQLIKEEKYEEAAVIRDQIKLLEGETR